MGPGRGESGGRDVINPVPRRREKTQGKDFLESRGRPPSFLAGKRDRRGAGPMDCQIDTPGPGYNPPFDGTAYDAENAPERAEIEIPGGLLCYGCVH